MSCRIRGIGSFLPPRVVTNAEVGALTGIAPERIASLFDVEERRWVRGIESPAPAFGLRCSDLGVAAATAALADAGLTVGDIDTIVTVSTTPDYMTPTISSRRSSARRTFRPSICARPAPGCSAPSRWSTVSARSAAPSAH
jgi:3-oxoacyl-[acyl-carrier-protein] synthase-3